MNKERKEILNSIRDYSEEQFDQLIVYLSGGGLVLTIGFVDDVIKFETSTAQWLLLSTWICFTISMITILFSHRSSLRSIDLELLGKDKKSDFWDTITKFFNWFGLLSFILGVILFLIYVMLNM